MYGEFSTEIICMRNSFKTRTQKWAVLKKKKNQVSCPVWSEFCKHKGDKVLTALDGIMV